MTPVRRSGAAARLVVAALVACALAPAAAQAQVAAPVATAFFSQDAAAPGTDVGLGVTLSNANFGLVLTGVSVSVTLPAGLVVSTPSQLFSSCGGTATAADGGSAIALTGGSLQGAGDEGDSCVVLLDVTPAGPGSLQVTSGAPGSTQSGPGAPSNTATLQVLTPPTIGESFAAPSIKVGATTTATYTLTNPNGSTRLYNVGFDDALPAGIEVAQTPNVTQTCADADVIASPGSATISLVGQQIEGGAQCVVSVDVTGTSTTSSPNATGPLTYAFDSGSGDLIGASAPGGTATLVVIGAPILSAAFAPATIAPGATSRLTFTLTNPNAATTLTSVAFNGALPLGLDRVVSAPQTETCGSIPSAGQPRDYAVAGVTLAPAAGCALSLSVTAVTVGRFATATSPVTSAEANPGSAAAASLAVAVPPPPPPVAPPPPPPPPPPPAPSSVFKITKLRAASDGTVRFDMKVPGAGDMAVALTRPKAKGSGKVTIGTKKLRPSKASTLHVKVRPTRTGRSIIRKAGKRVRVGVVIAFKRKGGVTRTVTKTVTVHRR